MTLVDIRIGQIFKRATYKSIRALKVSNPYMPKYVVNSKYSNIKTKKGGCITLSRQTSSALNLSVALMLANHLTKDSISSESLFVIYICTSRIIYIHTTTKLTNI